MIQMTAELQETKVCIGEVTETGKTGQKQEKRLRFPVSHKKTLFSCKGTSSSF